jgi:hypothetical protein
LGLDIGGVLPFFEFLPLVHRFTRRLSAIRHSKFAKHSRISGAATLVPATGNFILPEHHSLRFRIDSQFDITTKK